MFNLRVCPAAVAVGVWIFVLPVAASDVAAGKAIFEGKGGCGACHSIGDRGASLGPDLGEIGIHRSAKSLRLSLTDPNAEIYREYYTLVVVTKSGETVEGLALNEDDLSIQIRDINGNPRSFLKDDLKSARREQRSLMPSYSNRLSDAEIDDVVAYLRSLKGPPLPADAKRPRQPNHAYSDVSFLDRIGRDAEERPDSLVNALEIPVGASVADIGCGAGYFTWRLAEKVGPTGKVFAVDVQQNMLDRTAETLKKHQLSNVTLILGGDDNPHLPPESLDLIFIAYAYHEFSSPEAMMMSVKRALKPEGRLALIEFAEGRPFGPQDKAERMTINQIRAEIEPLGFELDRVLDLLPIQHGLIFTKTR